jgi:hypothetical protein
MEQELAYVNQKKSALVEEARVKDQDLMKLRAVCDRVSLGGRGLQPDRQLKRKAVLGPSHLVNEAVEEQVHSGQHQGQQPNQHQGQQGSGQRFIRPHLSNNLQVSA